MKFTLIAALMSISAAGVMARAPPTQSPASSQTNPQTLPAANGPNFPVLPRIADADPAIRHEIAVRIPTKLKVVRTTDMLTISFSVDSPQTLKVTVGQNMVIGFESDLRVYPEGMERPLKPRGVGLTSSLSNFGSGTSILNATTEGIPVPGTKYIVEEEITIFETDIPSQHMWAPKGSPNYKVLWQGVVKQLVN